MKPRSITRLLAIPAILIVLSSCFALFWLFYGRDIYTELSLRIYPEAQQVAEGYGLYGADTGQRSLYFWTPDNLDTVQHYYAEFTLPFIQDDYEHMLITAFNPYGYELVFYEPHTLEREVVDYEEQPRCLYLQRHDCVNIWLMPINNDHWQYVPDVIGRPAASSDLNATPFLASSLTRGTLIIYSYYINDF